MVSVDKRLLIGGVVVVGVLVFLLRGRFVGDARQVQQRVDAFCEVVSKTEAESNLVGLTRAQELSKAFAQSVHVETQLGGLNGDLKRSHLRDHAVIIRSQFKRLVFSLRGVSIDIGEDGIAVVTGTAVLKGEMAGGHSVNEATEVVLKLQKEDGKWRFTDCREVNVLRK